MEPILTPHKDALAGANLTVKDLKEPLKGKVEQLEAELSTNPSNHLKRTKLQNLSGKLAHEILDFVEASRPDDAPPAATDTPPANTTVTPPASTDTPPATTTVVPPAATDTPPPATTDTPPPATTDTPPASTNTPPPSTEGRGRSFLGRHRS